MYGPDGITANLIDLSCIYEIWIHVKPDGPPGIHGAITAATLFYKHIGKAESLDNKKLLH